MSSKTVLLIVVGTFCLSFTLLTIPITNIPEGTGDFLKGLGLAFILSALIIQYKLERKNQN
ncbi:MAG: hypothetical protein SH818_17715 [Saprospiraceae bacterium]|nr:hypothetical protein [Saprospiraceae bacterium]